MNLKQKYNKLFAGKTKSNDRALTEGIEDLQSISEQIQSIQESIRGLDDALVAMIDDLEIENPDNPAYRQFNTQSNRYIEAVRTNLDGLVKLTNKIERVHARSIQAQSQSMGEI
jgi:iron-sulfur cluster repair protein YtfE (RIC family)